MKIYFEAVVEAPFELVKKNFNAKLFLALKPPLMNLKLDRFDGCRQGDQVHLRMGALGVYRPWVSLITAHEDGAEVCSFIDEGKSLPWPLADWKHQHKMVKIDEHRTRIIDDINYQCSPRFMGPITFPFMWLMFSIRPSRYQLFFRNLA